MPAPPTWRKAAYGFTRTKREGDDIEAINRMFAPEFRNRLDAIITFAHLTPEIIAKVVEKFVLQLEAQLADRDVTIELSEEATKWLIEHGYDEQMGARPMARLIQEHIKKPLADEVLFGKLKAGGHVRVIVVKDEDGARQARLRISRRAGDAEAGEDSAAGGAKPKRRSGRRAASRPGPRAAASAAAPRLGAEGAAGQGVRARAADCSLQLGRPRASGDPYSTGRWLSGPPLARTTLSFADDPSAGCGDRRPCRPSSATPAAASSRRPSSRRRECPICTTSASSSRPPAKAGRRSTRSRGAISTAYRQHEPGLIGIGTVPQFAIGQRALLVRTPAGQPAVGLHRADRRRDRSRS